MELVLSLVVKFADQNTDIECLECLLEAEIAEWEELYLTKRRLQQAKTALPLMRSFCVAGYDHLLEAALSMDPSLANITDVDGTMPRLIHLAAAFGRAGAVRLLVDAGADVTGYAEDGRDWPLVLAAEYGSVETVKILLDAEHKSRYDGGWTALHWMAEQGRDRAVTTLINCGMSVNAVNRLGTTPLHVAAVSCSERVVAALLAAGADKNVVTDRKETVLHSAAAGGCPHLVRLLLDSSCVNLQDRSGRTPLHVAALWGNVEACEELLAAGADKMARNTRGRTAYDLANRRGHTAVMKLLRDEAEPSPAGSQPPLAVEEDSF